MLSIELIFFLYIVLHRSAPIFWPSIHQWFTTIIYDNVFAYVDFFFSFFPATKKKHIFGSFLIILLKYATYGSEEGPIQLADW